MAQRRLAHRMYSRVRRMLHTFKDKSGDGRVVDRHLSDTLNIAPVAHDPVVLYDNYPMQLAAQPLEV